MTRGAKSGSEVAELVAFEEKMMKELPVPLARERIQRVKAGYREREGEEAARRIHGAMVAELRSRRGASR